MTQQFRSWRAPAVVIVDAEGAKESGDRLVSCWCLEKGCRDLGAPDAGFFSEGAR